MSSIELLKSCAEDLMVVNAARVSVDVWHDAMIRGDRELINFLMREHHGTPFEHNYFQFRVEAPLFVFREWHRHRVGHSYNEMSGRYTAIPENFYLPEKFRTQHGKPGAYTFEEVENNLHTRYWAWKMNRTNKRAFKVYRWLLKRGVAKEQARTVLPVAMTSKMIWSCNARSLMHFINLRNSPTALQEIRDLAALAEATFAYHMPVTHQAFIDNGRVAP